MRKLKNHRLFIFAAMKNIQVFGTVLFLLSYNLLYTQNILPRVSLVNSYFSAEKMPGQKKVHQGYNAGVEFEFENEGYYIQPGLFFQNTSLFPDSLNIKKPLQKRIYIQSLKMPIQAGLYLINTELLALSAQAGVMTTFNIGLDENTKIAKNDLHDIRTSYLGSIRLKILFLTITGMYEHGMGGIYTDTGTNKIGDTSKERAFSVGLGIYF